MAKRGRPRKVKPPEDPVLVNEQPVIEPDEVCITGIAANEYDVQDELEHMEVDPYYEESARYCRDGDDPMGGIGLNFGDW